MKKFLAGLMIAGMCLIPLNAFSAKQFQLNNNSGVPLLINIMDLEDKSSGHDVRKGDAHSVIGPLSKVMLQPGQTFLSDPEMKEKNGVIGFQVVHPNGQTVLGFALADQKCDIYEVTLPDFDVKCGLPEKI